MIFISIGITHCAAALVSLALLAISVTPAGADGLTPGTGAPRRRARRDRHGTMARVALLHRSSPSLRAGSRSGLCRVPGEIDQTMSLYRQDSELVRVNARAGHSIPSPSTRHSAVISHPRRANLGAESDGAFDVPSLPLLRLGAPTLSRPHLGEGSDGGRHEGLRPVRTRAPSASTARMGIDLGGIAKGFRPRPRLRRARGRGHRSGDARPGGASASRRRRTQRPLAGRRPRSRRTRRALGVLAVDADASLSRRRETTTATSPTRVGERRATSTIRASTLRLPAKATSRSPSGPWMPPRRRASTAPSCSVRSMLRHCWREPTAGALFAERRAGETTRQITFLGRPPLRWTPTAGPRADDAVR
jgi:hypothetical protein